MNSALSPREIQSRLRAGASIPEVAAEAGVDVARIDGFALPVMAERAHMTRTALGSSVRRRGDGPAHRRLGQIVGERLQARGLDADTVEWDAWRQNDLKWRLVGLLNDEAASRAAEFIFDPKGLFSVADNADARWMIGEHLPGPQTDPDNENTIDFNDELALFRAVSDGPSSGSGATGRPGDDVPPFHSPYEGAAHTSELDELYDMLSGVSEDSVRIYLGLEDTDDSGGTTGSGDGAESTTRAEPAVGRTENETAGPGSRESQPRNTPFEDEPETTLADRLSEHPELEPSAGSSATDHDEVAADGFEDARSVLPVDDASEVAGDQDTSPASESAVEARPANTADVTPDPSPAAPEQDALVPDVPPSARKHTPAKKRASIPSWDEIMFGGPSRG